MEYVYFCLNVFRINIDLPTFLIVQFTIQAYLNCLYRLHNRIPCEHDYILFLMSKKKIFVYNG